MKKNTSNLILRPILFVFILLIAALGSCRNNTADSGNDSPQTEDKVIISPEANPHWQVVEVVGKDTAWGQVIGFLKKRGLTAADMYTWKNHLVVYGDLPGASALATAVRDSFPSDSVKYYPEAFYNFNRKYCADSGTTTAKEWDHILLTANLVADTTLQREYMDYHATQFEKWPEVAKGFCNASFQQLLVFRQGRQLILVISIPKGESLDKLNPKTEENNLRVKEWNKMMAKYQEGIPGTKRGETWVFLQPVR